ncbi:MAG: metallophosphoesterase family protein [Chitinispirillia bacterium]|jgi:predicted phosphodiesterase
MRSAIISDIHANLEALSAVLFDIESLNIDEIICLGDIIGYGPNPNECISLLHKKCPIILMGNHDAAVLDTLSTQNFNINAKIAIEWTEKHLTDENKGILKKLPMTKIDDNKTYVHATPYEPKMWYYITSVEEAAFNFQFFDTTFCFVGHTHIPMIIALDESKTISVSQEENLDFSKSVNSHYLINVGSVGQPRDRNPKSSYCIVDTDASLITLRRIDYDVKKCQEKMKKHKLPDFLISRLKEGK